MANNSSIMRRRIVLQRRTTGTGVYGAPTEEWEDQVVLCGSFEPLRGGEYFNSVLSQRMARTEARIRIRRRKDIDPARNRILFDGIIYDIQAVIPDAARGQTQLMVAAHSAVQPDGSKVND